VDLLPSEEQLGIVDQVRSFLQKEVPIARVREISASPSTIDPALWTRLAEVGWFGLALPEQDGGAGFGPAEQALLFREIGRHLTPGPILSTVIGAHVAAGAGETKILSAILGGDRVVALAHGVDHDAALDSGVLGDSEVSGSLMVLDAPGADLLLVATPRGCVLVDLPPQSVESLSCVDDATRLGRLDLRSAPVLARERGVALWHRGAVLSAAVCCGIAEAVRDASVGYATERVQYGRPIGSFQAVKHRCADMAVRAEVAFFQVCYAALAVQDGHPDAGVEASAAKIVAVDAAVRGAADNVQNHGGIGFTAEHDAQLYVKRAYVFDNVFGDARHHSAAILRAEIDASGRVPSDVARVGG
jgi:alkylation response protein AidB-like acyl-CoA dehydrogenase